MPKVISAVEAKSDYALTDGNQINTAPTIALLPQSALSTSPIVDILPNVDLLFIVTSTET